MTPPSPSHPASPQDVLAFLEGLGVATRTVTHEAAFTVEQSRHLVRDVEGAHTKNLFVKDKKGRFFLVVAEHEQRIDLKRLHERIGASGRLSFGTAEQLMALLGVTPGSVNALAVINDRDHQVTLVIDAELAASRLINCHPMINTMTTTIPREGLFAFFRATGHDPLIVALPAPEGVNEGGAEHGQAAGQHPH